MAEDVSRTVTRVLHAWQDGDHAAFEELVPLIYDELRRLAALEFGRERPGHTLQPTALVNEAYVRLKKGGITSRLKDRAHFLGIAARQMRQILVDHARAHKRLKRAGPYVQIALEDAVDLGHDDGAVEIIMLNEALEKLTDHDPFEARVIELRFFGSLTIEDVAQELGVSVSRIDAATRHARAWLKREMGGRP